VCENTLTLHRYRDCRVGLFYCDSPGIHLCITYQLRFVYIHVISVHCHYKLKITYLLTYYINI